MNSIGNSYSNQLLSLQVNLSDSASIQEAVSATISHFGAIDVVVNNAGYGLGGAIEELDEKEVFNNFDINVFAVMKVMKATLPHLRKQKSGHIINIASIAGFAASTGWSVYATTKFAIMGLSEVAAEDVKEFGIHVTATAPGAFHTSFLNEKSIDYASNTIDEYSAIRTSHSKNADFNGQQFGDPNEAASVIIKVAESQNPPIRLFLGTDAFNRAKAKINILETELEKNKEISLSTDFK
jgi:NAD(P)-dependent dehydrogenase (short-subunit alcohol dehydrogenase family)